MAKLGKKNKSDITDADTLILTDEELEAANERKTYGQTPGGGGVPDGEYVIECTGFERGVVPPRAATVSPRAGRSSSSRPR